MPTAFVFGVARARTGVAGTAWTAALCALLLAVAPCARAAESSDAAGQSVPDAVYVAERLPHVVIANCVLREERVQGDWRFVRMADLAAVAADRLEYVRGEDGRYAYILHAPPGERPVRFVQERSGRVVSEHVSDSAEFVSVVRHAKEAAAMHARLRSLIGQCAGEQRKGSSVSP